MSEDLEPERPAEPEAVAEPDGPGEPADAVRGYLMTRGVERDKDYRFLGAAPAALWWSSYREHADTNYPTLLVEAGEGGWRLFASGVPSVRRDVERTPIRFTLVLAGATAKAGAGGTAPGPDRVVRLVELWLEAFTGQQGRDRIGRLLDGAFPDDAEVVELRRRRDPEAVRIVRERLAAVLESLDGSEATLPGPRTGPPAGDDGPAEPLPADWFGAARSDEGTAAFVGRVRELVAGDREGRALVLNLVEDQAEAPEPRGRESLAVLSVDGGPVRPQPLVRSVPRPRVRTVPEPSDATLPGPPKKLGGQDPTGPTTDDGWWPLHRRAVLLLATPAGAAVLVLAIWYVTSRHSGGKP